MLTCKNCDQTILATDTVCWHCGQELKPTVLKAAAAESTMPEKAGVVSLTAVSIFATITLITLLLFIIVTNTLTG